MTFKAVIPHFERIVEYSKYIGEDLKSTPMLFLRYRDFILGNKELNDKEIYNIFDRFRKFLLSNNLTKDFRIEIIDNNIIIEYQGLEENLHYDIAKSIAGIFGVLGVKIIEMIYNKKDKYTRYKLRKTELFPKKEMFLKERRKLFSHNILFFTNYYRVINDLSHHLWIRLSQDSDIIINFNNSDIRDKWIRKIFDDIQKFSPREDQLLNFLKVFEGLNWIKIENEIELTFRFNINEKKFKEEKQYVLNIISDYANIEFKESKYHLMPKII